MELLAAVSLTGAARLDVLKVVSGFNYGVLVGAFTYGVNAARRRAASS
jgi:hypothetical protein